MYSWIKDFMYQRSARVKTDGHLSKSVKIWDGVLQGSVIVPTLFFAIYKGQTKCCRWFCCPNSHRICINSFFQKAVDTEHWMKNCELNQTKTTESFLSPPHTENICKARKSTYAWKRYTDVSWSHPWYQTHLEVKLRKHLSKSYLKTCSEEKTCLYVLRTSLVPELEEGNNSAIQLHFVLGWRRAYTPSCH